VLPFDPDISYTHDRLEKTSAHWWISSQIFERYEVSTFQMTMHVLLYYVDVFFPLLLPRLSDLSVYMSNTAGVSKAGSPYPSWAPEVTLGFWWGSCCLYFVLFSVLFYYVFLRSEFRVVIDMMFGTSLPPVVCKRTHVLFTLFFFSV
jgi:hypothetical protein